jgi:DNA invertase Pin-like site-specific DNA recombinase
MPADRAAAYGRSSDDKQDASCGQQRLWAAGKAAALGLELVAQEEDEGVPGDRLDRPGLERLFAKLERHQKARRPVAVLLAFDQDRLSRATSWATGAIMERLMRLGVERLVTATEQIDLYDDGARAIYGLRQDLEKRGYAKSLSKNVSRGMAMHAAAGRWPAGEPPYAYRVAGVRHNHYLVPGPPEEVEAVRELFRLAAEGVLTLPDLARVANERGWPLPAATARRPPKRGGPPRWTDYTVGHILHHPAYVGTIVYGRRRRGKYHQAAEGEPLARRGPGQAKAPPIVRENCHEPLVDRETWERAQAAVARRQVGRKAGRPRPQEYLFSERLICDRCGAEMQGRHQDGFHGYVCSTYRRGEGCSRNSVSEADLVDRVAALLARELSRPATLKRLRAQLEAKHSGRGDTLRLAVERGRAHVAELEKRYEAGGNRLLEVSKDLVPLVEKQLRQVKAELDAARHDLDEVERQATAGHAEVADVEELLSRLSALPELLRRAEPEERARVVRLAVASARLRFEVKAGPKGKQWTRWTGATVALRGDGPTYEMTLGGCDAPAPRGRLFRRPPKLRVQLIVETDHERLPIVGVGHLVDRVAVGRFLLLEARPQAEAFTQRYFPKDVLRGPVRRR